MSYSCLLVHTVLVCQERQPMLEPEMRVRLYPFLGSLLQQRKAALLAVNGMSDHVHALISLARTQTIAEVMREVKAISSRWIHEELWRPGFRWQSEYAAFSVSPSSRGRVERYIANQEQHHRKFDLRQEMLALLQAHGIEPSPHDPWLGSAVTVPVQSRRDDEE